jgi:DNA (cytosine-5)-methyltransferase 1
MTEEILDIEKAKNAGKGKKFWDLFSGAGLFSKALSLIGLTPSLAVEFEPWHAKTYAANFPDTPVLMKNIRKVNFDAVMKGTGKPEYMIGGIPCEGFSRARPDKSMSTDQNSLYKSFLRAAETAQPTGIAVEEVPEFLTLYKEGRRFMKGLSEMGYCISCGIVSSMVYGSAQDRRRFVMVARKDGFSFLPIPAQGTKMRTVEEAFSRIDYKSDPLANVHFTSPQMAKKISKIKPGQEFGWNGQKRLDPKRPSPTIVASTGVLHAHPRANRHLTVREVAELFDLPKNWKFVGSPRTMVSCMGDAVPIKLGIAVGYALMGKVLRKGNPGVEHIKSSDGANELEETIEKCVQELNAE